MVLAPVVAGSVMAGFHWWHPLLIVAWAAAYLAFMALRERLSRRRDRRAFLLPLAVWSLVALLIAVGLLVWCPALAWWAIPLVVLGGGGLALIVAGRERTVLNDALLIAASCLMAPLALTASGLGPLDWSGFVQAVARPGAWLLAAVLAGYFWGTILYVKTMIRQRGRPLWYAASVVYHALIAAAAFLLSPWLGLVGLLLLARAAIVPRCFPGARPPQIGAGEIVATLVVTVAACWTLPL